MNCLTNSSIPFLTVIAFQAFLRNQFIILSTPPVYKYPGRPILGAIDPVGTLLPILNSFTFGSLQETIDGVSLQSTSAWMKSTIRAVALIFDAFHSMASFTRFRPIYNL